MNTKTITKKNFNVVDLQQAMRQVIEANMLLKAAMSLYPLQLPRAGMAGKKADELSKSVAVMEVIFYAVYADEL